MSGIRVEAEADDAVIIYRDGSGAEGRLRVPANELLHLIPHLLQWRDRTISSLAGRSLATPVLALPASEITVRLPSLRDGVVVSVQTSSGADFPFMLSPELARQTVDAIETQIERLADGSDQTKQ